MSSQLTDLIRKKYPGHYDDMSDDDLETAILAKHPEYKDLATKPTESPKSTESPKTDTKVETKTEDLGNEPVIPDYKTSVSAEKDQPSEGWLSKGYHALTDPLTDAPSRFGHSISQYLTNPVKDESPNLAMIKGALGGGIEGIGNVLSGFTSPLNLATMGMAGAEGVAGKAGLESIAQLMNTGQKVAALPMIGHGGYEMLRPDATMGERGQGLAELAGGFAAGMHEPVGHESSIPTPMRDIGTGPIDMTEMPPEFHPVDSAIPPIAAPKYKDTNDLAYELAQNKFNMGKDLPSDVPRVSNEMDAYRNKILEEAGIPPEYIQKLSPEDSDVIYQHVLGHDVNPNELKSALDRNGLPPLEQLEPSNLDKGGTELDTTDPAHMEALSGSLPELKGSTIEEPQSTSNDTQAKPKGVLGNNVNVILKAEKATPETIKKALEAGYEFVGHNDNGDFRFKKSDNPSAEQPILEGELPQGKRLPLGPETDVKKGRSIMGEIANFPRTMMATMDMSAPLRQGIGLIHKPGFWKALGPMIKSFGSEKVFQDTMDSIAERPLFKSSVDNAGNYVPSFAEKSGLQLTDLGDITKREEAVMSQFAEKWIPGVRPSERAYTIFLNKLRADTFESLVKSGKVLGADGEVNVPLSKSIADFVNTATGRGSLGKLEKGASILNQFFFAPRLIASRLHMMDPRNYVTGDPMMRKEYLKSFLAIVGAGNAVGQLAKMAGDALGGDVEVGNNPTSADYGKIRIGKIRLDPFAGFQQYAVLASRIKPDFLSAGTPTNTGITPVDNLTGLLGTPGNQTTSSTTGKSYTLGEKFGRQTRFDVAERFLESKLSPILSLATAFLHGKDFNGNKFSLPEEVATRFVPLFVQDMKNLLTEDPNITSGYDKELHPENLPLAIPGFFGMGTQLYGDRTKAERQ